MAECSAHDEGVLIFPGGMEGGLAFARRHASAHRRVIGASSLSYDPASRHYDEWIRLPFVTEPGFDDALKSAIAERVIAEIFTAHPVVGTYLERRLEEIAPGVRLSSESVLQAVDSYRHHIADVDRLRAGIWDLARPDPRAAPLSGVEGYALLRAAGQIPGH